MDYFCTLMHEAPLHFDRISTEAAWFHLSTRASEIYPDANIPPGKADMQIHTDDMLIRPGNKFSWVTGYFLVYSHFWCIFGPFGGISGRNTPKPLRLGYFAWCIPKVTAPTRHFRPKLMPPVHSLDLFGVFPTGYFAHGDLACAAVRGCVLGYSQWGISLPLAAPGPGNRHDLASGGVRSARRDTTPSRACQISQGERNYPLEIPQKPSGWAWWAPPRWSR
jgi:hypothetical protein